MCILAGTFLFTLWVAQRFFGVEREMGYLLAAGTAVCGAAAILATAEIVRARPQQTTIAVTLITVLGTLTLLAYPVAFATGYLPGLGEDTYGVFIGATVYEVAQVVGASYAVLSWPATQRLWLSSAGGAAHPVAAHPQFLDAAQPSQPEHGAPSRAVVRGGVRPHRLSEHPPSGTGADSGSAQRGKPIFADSGDGRPRA